MSLNNLAFRATLHCLTGCAVGEVLGMVLGTGLGWSNGTTTVAATVLAFLFGYGFTLAPLLRSGLAIRAALPLAFASDTLSITLMEVVDNLTMLLIPGAMGAGLGQPLFWIAMAISLALAGLLAFPLNRWLISRGRGHAVVHAFHGHGAAEGAPVSAVHAQHTHHAHH